jgi:hypothetical protein
MYSMIKQKYKPMSFLWERTGEKNSREKAEERGREKG